MKPGGAVTADATGVPDAPAVDSRLSSAATAEAISSGARRIGLASFSAMFVARSPWSGLAGRWTSTPTAGASGAAGGRVPDAIAAARARSTAWIAALRRVGSVAGLMLTLGMVAEAPAQRSKLSPGSTIAVGMPPLSRSTSATTALRS